MIARLLAAALAASMFVSLHAQEEEAPPAEPSQTLKAEETEALREAKGELVIVEGGFTGSARHPAEVFIF